MVGKFNGGDRSEDLGSNGANPASLGCKGGEDILLYFCLVLFWSVLPPESSFVCTCLFLGPSAKAISHNNDYNGECGWYGDTHTSSESVLESETCGISEMRRSSLIDKLRGE